MSGRAPVLTRAAAGGLGLVLMAGGVVALAGGGPLWWIGVLILGLLLAQLLLLDLWPVKTPVIMYHSVVGDHAARPTPFRVLCRPEVFEGCLRYLKWRGFHTVSLQELHDHLDRGAPLPKRPVVLTFDDGYLDNWVYVHPLLEKHGFRGTVFVPTDFIQPGDEVRPTLSDVWAGRVAEDELERYGYLNRAEIRVMASRGILEIQSHSHTHTWVPVAEEIVDYHRPDLPLRELRWMWWNRYPERKPFWFHEVSHAQVDWGAPVYRSELALAARRIAPDPELERILVRHVHERGGRAFFGGDGWRDELDRVVEAYRREKPSPVRVEPDDERRDRLRDEMEGSRRILEQLTGKEVRFLCWPNGRYGPEALDLLGECGYLAATVPSWTRGHRTNHRGTPPDRISRITSSPFFDAASVWPWVLSFALKLELNRGNRLMLAPIRAIWLLRRLLARRARPVPEMSE